MDNQLDVQKRMLGVTSNIVILSGGIYGYMALIVAYADPTHPNPTTRRYAAG